MGDDVSLRRLLIMIIVGMTVAFVNHTLPNSHAVEIPRDERLNLPIQEDVYEGSLGLTRNLSSKPSYPEHVAAPDGAPNILLILTDDVGFGASTTYGGVIPTPIMDKLADQGAQYNNFHTAALCAPSRASLLTGRNHHAVGMGVIAEMSTGYPGYNTIIPKSAASIGEVFKQNGYSTAWFGKNHITPDWEITPAGPYDRWPTGLGFEYFYGFMGGATNAFVPMLYENTTPVEADMSRGDYYLGEDLANHAINWIRNQKRIYPEKPFLIHYAPLAAHTPNMAPKEWVEKFKGEFDMGWDELREKIYHRQLEKGIIPEGTALTERPSEFPAWDSLSDDEKKIAVRLMEAYAAQIAYADFQIGRVLTELKTMGEFDNTIIIYMQGDNGSTGEGGLKGTTSGISAINGHGQTIESMMKQLDKIGVDPHIQNNIPTAFGWAMDTPFQWTKGIASHFGGTRCGMVVHWPDHIKEPGRIRKQFHHMIDIVPTLYEITGIPAPETVNGVKQMPIHGVSMAYTFGQPDAKSLRTEQYFELFANRAFYRDGWIASTRPLRTPGNLVGVDPNPEDYQWELYHIVEDYSQSRNLAAQYPEKLKELQTSFNKAAEKYNVFPIDGSGSERFISTERPYPLKDRKHFIFSDDEQRYYRSAWPDYKNKSWTIDFDLGLPPEPANGTLVEEGGRAGGWGIMIKNGVPEFILRIGPDDLTDEFRITANRALKAGRQKLKIKFDYDGGGFGKGGEVTILSKGELIGKGRVAKTVPFIFQEGASVGRSYGTTLNADYSVPSEFNGIIHSMEVVLGNE